MSWTMCTSWSQRVREVLLNDLGVEFVWVEWMMLLAKDESSNLSHRITVNFEDLCQLLPLVTWFVHTKSFNFELTKRCVLNTLSQTRNDVDLLCLECNLVDVIQIIPWFNESFSVTHLPMRSARNTIGTRGTLEWHMGLVVPLVRGPKWS